MASPGDKLRSVWTADFYNRLAALLSSNGNSLTAAGRAYASNGRRGSQIFVPDTKVPLSTIQGLLAGGAAQAVTDGTEIIDPYAWGAYTIQGAYFKTAAGTTNVTVIVNGTPVSWISAIAVNSAGILVPIPSPVTDLTHIINPEDFLSIQLSGSSADCTGFQFTLNTPF